MNLALILVLGIALHWVHVDTRENYRGLGISDGKLRQRVETYELLKRSVKVHDCNEQPTAPKIELLAVKAYSMNMIPNADGSVTFCHYE